MRRARAAASAAGLMASFAAAHPLRAQSCEPGPSSNEALLFGVRSLSLAMTRAAATASGRPGTVRGGIEGVWMPRISDADARPTTCRPGKGPENVNALAVAARARVSVVLAGRVQVDASWLPPVTLEGIRGNLLGVAVSHTRRVRSTLDASLRVHGTVGSITGPFTCPPRDVRDATSECFEGNVSRDRLRPNVFGGDVALDWAPERSRFTWFGGAGYSFLAPRFRVGFRNSAGDVDSTRVFVDLHRATLFAGVTRAAGSRWRVSGEVYATPSDGATARITFDGVLREGR